MAIGSFVHEILKWQLLTFFHLTLLLSRVGVEKFSVFSKLSEADTCRVLTGVGQCAEGEVEQAMGRCRMATGESSWMVFWAFKNKWNRVRVCLSELLLFYFGFPLKWVTFLKFSDLFDISLDVISAILRAFPRAQRFIKLLSYSKTYLIKIQFYGACTNYYSWLEDSVWTCL